MNAFIWTPTQWCGACFNQAFVGTFAHELGHTVGSLGHTDAANSYGPGLSNTFWPASSPTDYWVETSCWGQPLSACQGGCASNNFMGYNADRHYFSPQQIGAFYYGVYSGKTTKFAIGYQDFNPCTYDSTKTISITTDTTWGNVVVVRGDVVVQPGKTLTIRCAVSFTSGSRLIIKPTARVVLDGGTLTSRCGFWQGVQVQGNKNQAQFISRLGMPVYQGLLVVKNGGAIMNAQVGVTTIAKFNNGNQDWNMTGGIIQATAGNFNGNIKDVEFLWYQNTNSGSFFTNCGFSAQNQPNGGWPDARVSFYGVKGVRFYGCTFQGNTSGTGALRDNGISGADAGFTVDSSTSTLLTTFTSFIYGINVQNSTLFNDPITVNAATFHVNFKGSIFLSKSNYATITNNYFKQWYGLSTQTNPDYGVYINQSTGYSIRKNLVDGWHTNSGWHYGICINKSGSGNNSVYNNYFSDLKYGLLSQEENQGTNGVTGLIMNCNEFSNCTTNVSVSGTQNNPNGNGVLAIQGSLSNPALYVRNRYNAPSCGSENLYAISNVLYKMWHPSFVGLPYQPIPQPSCSDSNDVRLYQLTGTYNSSYCPANCTGCRTIREVEQSIISKENILASLRNSGDTEQKKFYQYELDFEKSQLGILSNDRIRQFLNDTSLKNPLDSVIAELKLKRNPDYNKQLASVYLQKGNSQLAQDFLDSAKAEEPLNTDMYDIGKEAISAHANPSSYMAGLKSNVQLKNKLVSMANNPLSDGFGQSRALLNLAFGTKFNEHWVLSQNTNRQAQSFSRGELVTVFPNPAQDELNIGYLVAENETVTLSLMDVSGRTIKIQKLVSGNNLHKLDTKDLNNGFYFVSLHSAGKLISTNKVIISK